MMHDKDKVLPRACFNVAPNGNAQLSAIFFGSVDDMKQLVMHYDCKPLYLVRVKDVKPGAQGYFEWCMWQLGINFETHGHA